MSLPGQRDRYTFRLFAIAGIPISLSPWFAALAFFVVFRASSVGVGILALIAATLSVLVHELGHAFAAKRYDLRPHVVIHGLGGYCERLPARSSEQDLVVVAGGPVVGLILGALAGVAAVVWPSAPWWYGTFFWNLAIMGIFWSLLNLLPIPPLDGGKLFELIFGSRRFDAGTWSYRIGMPLAGLVAVVAIVLDQLFIGLLFAYLAGHNAYVLSGHRVGHYGPEWEWYPLKPLSTGLAIALIVATGVASWGGPTLVELDPAGVLVGQVWRLVSWPLATTMLEVAVVAAVVALIGREVETRWTWRMLVMLALGVVLGGLAGLPVGALLGEPVRGSGAIGLCIVAAWTAADPWALVDRRVPVVRIGLLGMLAVLLVPVHGINGSLVAALVAGATGWGWVAGLAWMRRRKEASLMRNPPVIDLGDWRRRKQEDQEN